MQQSLTRRQSASFADAGVAVIGPCLAAIDTEHSIATLKTINAIGGGDSEVRRGKGRRVGLRVDAPRGDWEAASVSSPP